MTPSQIHICDIVVKRASEIDMPCDVSILENLIVDIWDTNISRFDNLYNVTANFGEMWYHKFWEPGSCKNMS